MERRALFLLMIVFSLLALVAGCSHEAQVASPAAPTTAVKDGTETLGPPSILIADGSGFVEGGVGMVGVSSAELSLEVPAGAQVVQALLYWAGGTTAAAGDDEISLDGTLIQGGLVGGPTPFYDDYSFSAYRADITGLGLVGPGTNTFTVADFDFTGANVDENNGASLLVIYDDGSDATVTLRDGLDMSYFGFAPTLNATVPQVFAIVPHDADRVAELVIFAASVGENRPNRIRVTTSAGEQLFDDALGSYDGLQWDSLVLPIAIAGGVDEVSVELVSTVSYEPLGASLGWVVAGLAMPAPAPPELFTIGGAVFGDADRDGAFAAYELGIADVVVELRDDESLVATVTTGPQGEYTFEATAGNYTVVIDLAAYPDAINADLALLFDPTGPLSLPASVGPDLAGLDFGFVPGTDQILAGLESGELLSDALSTRHWRRLLRRALVDDQSCRQAHGHDGRGGDRHGDRDGRGHGHGHDDDDDGGGWGHSENYYSGEELIEFLNQVQSLYLIDPYQFTPGNELREAYDIVRSRPRDDEGKLLRELLVTELNFVSGRGLLGQSDVLGALIAWGESLLNFTEDEGKASPADKGRGEDLAAAVAVFGVINTGGGGGVDE